MGGVKKRPVFRKLAWTDWWYFGAASLGLWTGYAIWLWLS